MLQPADVTREFEQRIWRHEDGLPDNRVKAILQTGDGYLWLATMGGLARFDGQKFTVFDHLNAPEFMSDQCIALAEDRDGGLWVAATDGVIRKQGNNLTRVRAYDYTPPSCGLCTSKGGGILVANNSFVGWVNEKEAKRFEPNWGGHGACAVDEGETSGTVWLCAEDGLVRYDPARSQFELAPMRRAFERLVANAIWRSPSDERWVLFSERVPPPFLGPRGWLACFKDGRWIRSPNLAEPDLVSNWSGRFIAPDAFGALWLPGTNFLHRFVAGRTQQIPRPHAAERDFVLCAFSDREGNLWLGTEFGGLERWTTRKLTTYTARDGLAGDNTWTICEARDGSIWVGTDGGITRIKDRRLTNIPLQDVRTQGYVRSIVEDSNGVIWAGTMKTLMCLSNGTISEIKFPGEWFETKIRALLAARDGGMWVGTVRGLTLLKDGRRTKYTKADGLGSDEVRALLEEDTGDLWIGTLGGGLSRFHDGRFTTYSTTNGLSSTNVWALLQDSEGALWIGTDNGLNRLKNGRITSFNVDEGLPNRLINCLLEDNAGRFWISHDRGLYWVRKRELDDIAEKRSTTAHPVLYDESDGLPTPEFNGQKSFPAACKTRDGRLWFPTAKGVIAVDPAKALFDEVTPLTAIEQARANGDIIYGTGPEDCARTNGSASIAAGAKLRLSAGGGRVVQIHYTANTFIAPEKAKFRYRLRGLTDHWIEAGTRREAYFTGLRPGDYEFEVIACNHHGVWQERGAAIGFQLAPFYYQTWWFYTICGAGLAALVVLLVAWRVRELRKLHQLEQFNALNLQRDRIARDIHDELGASLTHILQLSSEPIASPAPAPEARSQRKQIATIAEETLDNISEIVWANNPKYDTLEDLVAYLREYAANLFSATSIRVRFDFPESVPRRQVSGSFRRHLLLLVKEALQNIAKHAAASQVSFQIALSDGTLELRIADDGCGFSLGKTNDNGYRSRNGLANMRQRAAELGGLLEVASEPGAGTELRASFPLEPD